ncbi:bifunctional Bromodomain/Bromodomain-like superfamily [Babesia duncani]|uniref:Bifunctional Bromodomain/Bromodomain-like superfamily n=1 Tax=Babesia duncani TaxID=323732 RepID=A0AAD9PLS3_9APIC|nr:bifunctional Bromodomain/Bromodomain-like superfamily [Babesia duncani]
MISKSLESCHRGELIILSQEEVTKINAEIEVFNFRLELLLDHGESKKTFINATVTLEPKPKRRSTLSSRTDWSDILYGDSDDLLFQKRPARVRKQPVAYVEEFYEDLPVASPRRVERHKPEKAPLPSMYKTVSNILRTLPKLPKDTWEYTCYRILQTIKYMDTDKWFWYPVHPVADGVPNYLNVVKYPMDFQTIIERLHRGHYTHPVQWQVDVRQIFYNAFLFYPSDNVIYKAAEHVCSQFESKLATTKYVHNDDFLDLLALGSEAAKATILNYNEENFSRRTATTRKTRDLLDEAPQVLGKRTKGQRKVIEYEYGGDEDQASEYDASYMGSSSEHSADEFPSMDIPDLRKKRSNLGHKSHAFRNISTFPVPSVGHVPPPPPLQTLTGNDKNLTTAQQRTLDFNMTRLAPNQRKAALELVEDDLGILADHFKDDVHFTFDASLLPIEKQRRIFLYVNQMARRNEGLVHAQTGSGTSKRKGKEFKEIFENSAGSSSSSLSDVASNFLSSDEFFSSDDDNKPQDADVSLPEYKSVDEREGTRQLNKGVMGNHVDFLGRMELSREPSSEGDSLLQSKSSAWMEWKGQVIHHGTVAQQNGVPPRSVDEQIAEGYDARI